MGWLLIKAVFVPKAGVGIDVLPNLRVPLLRAHNMVMEGFLPDRVGKPFGNYTFKLLYNGRDCRGDHWSPALPVLD